MQEWDECVIAVSLESLENCVSKKEKALRNDIRDSVQWGHSKIRQVMGQGSST